MRRYPDVTAWIMTTAMAGLTAIIFFVSGASPLIETPARWWMLAIGFLATESQAVHLLTRRGAHTLSPVEIPLLLSLGVLTGPGVIAARVLASLLYVGVIRRQSPLKAAFNTASSGLGAAVAVVVANLNTGPIDSPGTWLWLLGGTIAGGVTTSVAVAAVLSTFDPERTWADTLDELGVAAIQVTTGALVGLAILLPVAVNAWSVMVTLLLAIGFHAAFRLYGNLRQRHAELESLYEFSNLLDKSPLVEDLVGEALAGVGRALNARTVELVLDADGERLHHRLEDGVVETRPLEPETGLSAPPDPSTSIVAPLHSGPETSIGWISASGREAAVAFDASDRRLMEAMASHAAASLSRALVERRLRAQVAHNEELIRSKDQLIAAVSHELRTPLTGILGFADILAGDASDLDDELRRDLASSIAGEALDLSFIVEDLLTAARFDLGQLAMKLEHIDVIQLVEGAIAPISQRLGVRLECQLASTLVIADPPRARQILRNLVVNATRYGGTNMLVRSEADGQTVVVEVCDDGEGVPRDDTERIFLPYQTAHPATTQPGSVGLGLPISRELARMMGGEVDYLRRGNWTVFRLRLLQVAASEALPDPLTESLAG